MTADTSTKSWPRRHPVWTAIFIVLAGIVLLLLLAWLLPFRVSAPDPNPAASYDDAMSRIAAIQAAEDAQGDVLPECRTTALTHDQTTDQAIVLLHGFTSCPEQFRALGQEFYDLGYNVYIPRTPSHGLVERIENDTRNLRAPELVGFASTSADIAQGLGEHVTVAGLSGGGTLATWLAENRSDVDVAVPIAPFLGIGFIPALLNRPLTHLLAFLPGGFYLWWDPVRKADNPFTASFAYPRYSLRSLAELLVTGYAAERDMKKNPPASENVIVIYNANDDSVSNAIIEQFVALWQKQDADAITTYQFDKSLGLPHDLITPTRPGARTDLSYPVIIDLIQSANQDSAATPPAP